MKHELSLEVIETYNPKILRVVDTSLYIEDIEVKCGILQITAPGFKSPVQIEVDRNFSEILTACTLGIQLIDCGVEDSDLPDGIYNIKYSVSPNDKVYAEYNYLRATKTLNSYYEQLAGIEVHGCVLETCHKVKLKELREIKSLIDIAKAKVEFRGSLEEGMEMLRYAQKKLRGSTKKCCN